MTKPMVLLVERDEELQQHLQTLLLSQGFEISSVSDVTGVLHVLRQRRGLDLLIINAWLETSEEGLELAQLIRRADRHIPTILLVTHSSEDLAIAALRAGVNDYLKSPFTSEALLASIRRCLPGVPAQHTAGLDSHTSSTLLHGEWMIGKSPQMQHVKTFIGKVAMTDSSALVTGETGTGKELVAALIHQNSCRRQKPFVPINCAAIPDGLLESELFGHERGAFTGAYARKDGALKVADGGTVFFDEIGDMSPYAQAKILRVIESKEVQRLGGRGSLPVDIRIIAATNRNLERMMATEQFRSDLFFRLNVATIHLPPLRERKEDLPDLFTHCIATMNRRFGVQVEGVTEETLAFLLRYDWPGNVRELRNLVEAIYINQPSRWITVTDLPEPFRRRFTETAHLPPDEREQVLQALFSTNWNKRLAAQKLHWSRMTLYRKLAKYHIVSGGKLAKAPEQEIVKLLGAVDR
ncbi:MAG: sigma-54-dependent Fis family transcriptional regulator [Deltaproteobacteria bacterium]|nr:sigma-54-dependent Fis family transcriptional regulator [Deltaproteobacteria bacterium]